MRAPAQNPQALFTELDDGTGVLLHLETKFYFTLNPTAVIVWKELAQGGERAPVLARIAARLSAEFQVDAETAARDVEGVLADLLEDGLLLEARG
ncbi:MAG: PqqD family protein [Minicystis sp.]